MAYDFKEARQRIVRLGNYYRRLSKTQPKDGTWDWWLEVEMDRLEREMTEGMKKMIEMG